MDVERMMDIENHNLAATTVITVAGKNNWGMLNWVGKMYNDK